MAKKSIIQWQDYIGVSLRKSAEATLETAERIAKFKNDTDTDLFNKHMKEWFGMTPTHLSYWSKISENMPRFSGNTGILPTGTRTLYELTGLDDDLWEELVESHDITPALTVEAAKGLKENGGLIKKIAKKYEDSIDFLEIMTKLKEIKGECDTLKQTEKVFNKWIKENPPEFIIDEEEDDDYNTPNRETDRETDREQELLHKTSLETRAKCLKLFGIILDGPITNARLIDYMEEAAKGNGLMESALHTLRQP